MTNENPEQETRRVSRVIPLAGMRRSIAEHMLRSLQESAQLTTGGMLDMTGMVRLRQALLAKETSLGAHITYTDLLVLAVARALEQHPLLNASIVGEEIRVWEDINIGVAVSYEIKDITALVVPVLRHANKLSLVEAHQALGVLVDKARRRRLAAEDVADGTFTLSNTGTYEKAGELFSTPILNQPQVALLVVRALRDMPVVRDGQVVVRSMMPYSLTIDHRVVDGLTGGQFRATLAQLVEEPQQLLSFLRLPSDLGIV